MFYLNKKKHIQDFTRNNKNICKMVHYVITSVFAFYLLQERNTMFA